MRQWCNLATGYLKLSCWDRTSSKLTLVSWDLNTLNLLHRKSQASFFLTLKHLLMNTWYITQKCGWRIIFYFIFCLVFSSDCLYDSITYKYVNDVVNDDPNEQMLKSSTNVYQKTSFGHIFGYVSKTHLKTVLYGI